MFTLTRTQAKKHQVAVYPIVVFVIIIINACDPTDGVTFKLYSPEIFLVTSV